MGEGPKSPLRLFMHEMRRGGPSALFSGAMLWLSLIVWILGIIFGG